MEYLLGRSLANNLINLRLDPVAQRAALQKHIDWLGVLEAEHDPGLGNGGLRRPAACFLDSMATLSLPAMGYRLRYQCGMFAQSVRNGWQGPRGGAGARSDRRSARRAREPQTRPLGADRHRECGRLGSLLERSYDRGIRRRDLANGIVPGSDVTSKPSLVITP